MKKTAIIASVLAILLIMAVVFDLCISTLGVPYDKMQIGSTLKELAVVLNDGRGREFDIVSFECDKRNEDVIEIVIGKCGVRSRCRLVTNKGRITEFSKNIQYIRPKLIYLSVCRLFKKDTAAPITQLDLPDESSAREEEVTKP